MNGGRPHVCPWWLAYSFDNPLRRLLHDPASILGGFLEPGDVAADLGCGMGYFTLAMARIVGPKGRVIAADVQEEMLRRVGRRAERAGLDGRIVLHRCRPDSLALSEKVDFALAFWVVHEAPDAGRFLADAAGILKPGGGLLIAEPRMHVGAGPFERTVALAREAGFEAAACPAVAWSRAAAFVLPPEAA